MVGGLTLCLCLTITPNYTSKPLNTKQVLCSQSLHLKGDLEGVCVCQGLTAEDICMHTQFHLQSHRQAAGLLSPQIRPDWPFT